MWPYPRKLQIWLHLLKKPLIWKASFFVQWVDSSEQRGWTHFWHFVNWIELQPICSPKTPQGPTFETLLFIPHNICIQFVLSTFTLRLFPSTAFFHRLYFSITLFNDSPHEIRSSAYNNSINEPSRTSSVLTSITMINKVDSKQTLYGHEISPFTKYPGTSIRRKGKRINYLGTQSKAFSTSTDIKNNSEQAQHQKSLPLA